jgi:hypothetical protein
MAVALPEHVIAEFFSALDGLDVAAIGELLGDEVAMVDEVTRGWIRGKASVLSSLAPTFAAVQSIQSTVSDVHVDASTDSAVVTCVLDQTYVIDGSSTHIAAPTSYALRRAIDTRRIVVMHSVPLANS